MTDLKKFIEILNNIRMDLHDRHILMENYRDVYIYLDQLEILFKKHYNISEDEILKLAQGILIKKEKFDLDKFNRNIVLAVHNKMDEKKEELYLDDTTDNTTGTVRYYPKKKY